jgi:hypothetical protein
MRGIEQRRWPLQSCASHLTHGAWSSLQRISADCRHPRQQRVSSTTGGADHPTFCDFEAVRYEWERSYRVDEWVAAAATFGDVIALPTKQRDDLLAAVRATVDAHGGNRTVHVVTSLVTARRA